MPLTAVRDVAPSETDLASALLFIAAGGQHDDWDEFDAVIDRERRLAVHVDPLRIYGNPGVPADATRQELSSLTGPTEDVRESQ
jgi:hypothetical protein